jgi:hypothetical protein
MDATYIMVCNKCKSEWKTGQGISKSLTSCPFCGENLVNEDHDKPKTFDNSKDTLVFIAEQHGDTVLLGKQLKSFFPDYAPQVSANIKSLVFAVYEKGAAAILQANLNAKQEAKEIAFKQAVAKLTEAFIAERAAENIIQEFAAALGWQLNASQPVHPSVLRQSAQTQHRSKPQAKVEPVEQTGNPTGIAAEIAGGKTRNIQFGGRNWLTLDVVGSRALLLTEDIIEKRAYGNTYTNVTWDYCTLRQYLNGEFFYKRFSTQDQTRILLVGGNAPNNQWNTSDKIFLLSKEEVSRYFRDSGQLENRIQNSDQIKAKYNGVEW